MRYCGCGSPTPASNTKCNGKFGVSWLRRPFRNSSWISFSNHHHNVRTAAVLLTFVLLCQIHPIPKSFHALLSVYLQLCNINSSGVLLENSPVGSASNQKLQHIRIVNQPKERAGLLRLAFCVPKF